MKRKNKTYPIPEKVTLLDVLSFISKANSRQLRAIDVAMLNRTQSSTFTVTLPDLSTEHWTVDGMLQLAEIQAQEDPRPIFVTRSKEFCYG